MASKLYVGGLSYSTTSESLRTLFAQHGTAEPAEVVDQSGSIQGVHVIVGQAEPAGGCGREFSDGDGVTGREG